jgi:hypothetical protein
MYRVLPTTDRLGFGDVISADWMFDLYLRHDAVALKWEDRANGRVWLRNVAPDAERPAGKDGVLSHADEALGSGNRRQAIILTDDCEMETFHKRRTSAGRILFAAIRPASAAEIAEAQASGTYRRFVLPPDTDIGFAGGIVELQRIYSVSLPSLTANPKVHERVVGLDPDAQTALSQFLCAHVTRHGPLVAAKESAKLAMMLSANGDADVIADFKKAGSTRAPETAHVEVATTLTQALFEAWALEHGPLNFVSDEWEQGADPAASVAEVRAQVERARDAFDNALRLLDGVTAA